jgi:hypothetical protein
VTLTLELPALSQEMYILSAVTSYLISSYLVVGPYYVRKYVRKEREEWRDLYKGEIPCTTRSEAYMMYAIAPIWVCWWPIWVNLLAPIADRVGNVIHNLIIPKEGR